MLWRCDNNVQMGVAEEGDRPKELGHPEFQTELGTSTISLMCRMKKTLCGTGKMVIMDSDFCVLIGLIGKFYRGLYGSVLVNENKYCPTGIYCDQINAHCGKRYICEHEFFSGNWKGVNFDVFAKKETNYIIIMIPTYSGLIVHDNQKEEYQYSKVQVIKFKYE